MTGGGWPASAYALALAHRDCVKSLKTKHNRKSSIVRPMKRPTILGTVIAANAPVESEKKTSKYNAAISRYYVRLICI